MTDSIRHGETFGSFHEAAAAQPGLTVAMESIMGVLAFLMFGIVETSGSASHLGAFSLAMLPGAGCVMFERLRRRAGRLNNPG